MRSVSSSLRAVRTGGTVCAGATVCVAYSTASIAIAVDAGVNSVSEARAVRAMNALGTATIMVAGGIAETLATSV